MLRGRALRPGARIRSIMKKTVGAFLTVAATVTILAGCNSSNNNNVPGNGTYCGGPGRNMEVLYPAPNAKNVQAATLTAIYVSTSSALPPSNSFNFLLNTSVPSVSYYTGNFGQVNASQIPTPHAKPTYSNPVYYATSLGGAVLPLNSAIQMLWNDGGTACTPNTIVSTFSTGS
jgi:hypothetical protein